MDKFFEAEKEAEEDVGGLQQPHWQNRGQNPPRCGIWTTTGFDEMVEFAATGSEETDNYKEAMKEPMCLVDARLLVRNENWRFLVTTTKAEIEKSSKGLLETFELTPIVKSTTLLRDGGPTGGRSFKDLSAEL